MDKLIKIIEENQQTGAIGYSLYIQLITESRMLQFQQGSIDKLIKIIQGHYDTEAIGHSLYIELITEVRYQQMILQQVS